MDHLKFGFLSTDLFVVVLHAEFYVMSDGTTCRVQRLMSPLGGINILTPSQSF